MALLTLLPLVVPATLWADIRNGPYLQQVTTSSVLVCWTSTQTEPGKVLFGPTQQLGKAAVSSKTMLHRAKLTGLDPSERYYYRVQSGRTNTAIYSFQTAPRAGEAFSFIVYGDTKNNPMHNQVIARAVALQPAIVVTTGDLVDDGRKRDQWDLYFKQAAPLLARAPNYPLLGNHERDSRSYYALFALPEPERFYSFDYGDAHFIVLDSNHPVRNLRAQRQWLEADLEKHKDLPYIFVFMHHPLYTCTLLQQRREDAAALRRIYEDLLRRYRVSIVFAGHDHNYQHNVVDEMHYVVTGGGGASLYPVLPLPFTQKAAAVHHLIKLDLAPDRLNVHAVLPDGQLLDEWEIAPRTVGAAAE